MIIIPVVQTTVHALQGGFGGNGLNEGGDLRNELDPVRGITTHLHEALLVQELLAQIQNLRRAQN